MTEFKFTDPRTNIKFKQTDYPFLLFPLRLETRFKSVEVSDGSSLEQLWVRVYPDDCLVDTFEEIPSESENKYDLSAKDNELEHQPTRGSCQVGRFSD